MFKTVVSVGALLAVAACSSSSSNGGSGGGSNAQEYYGANEAVLDGMLAGSASGVSAQGAQNMAPSGKAELQGVMTAQMDNDPSRMVAASVATASLNFTDSEFSVKANDFDPYIPSGPGEYALVEGAKIDGSVTINGTITEVNSVLYTSGTVAAGSSLSLTNAEGTATVRVGGSNIDGKIVSNSDNVMGAVGRGSVMLVNDAEGAATPGTIEYVTADTK